MAIYKIFPTKDSTIYSEFPEVNTGIDEILECSSTPNNTSRFLIQFSQDEISNVITNLIKGKSYKAEFNSFIAHLTNLYKIKKIFINPVYEGWDMGVGRLSDNPNPKIGVSWTKKNDNNSWDFETLPQEVTGSFIEGKEGGGNWYISPQSEYELSYGNSKDLKVDITSIVNLWDEGEIENNGLIIRQDPLNEFPTHINQPSEIKYFSIDTNTIYPPYIKFKWDDYVEDVDESLDEMGNMDYLISISNNSNKYFNSVVKKFRINATPKYPPRVYKTRSLYGKNSYLPLNNAYYAIKDVDTNLNVIDFDEDYTKISADKEGSYFNLYMNGLEPERYFTILIKIKINGEVRIFDTKTRFKVING